MNQRKTKKYMGYSGLLVILLIAIDQFTNGLPIPICTRNRMCL